MDLSTRSYQKELLDSPDIPFDAIRRNMDELHTINTWLGGHRVTLSGIKKLLPQQYPLTICEIGCGGGDNLMVISQWLFKRSIPSKLLGIDINPHCIAVARARFQNHGPHFLVSDYRLVDFETKKPGIIFSSLFCHHFTDEELISMLQWMRRNSENGFFIADLHRHSLAYRSIQILTRLFSRSYLVKNDAPLSVLRGFTRKEWENLLYRAGITGYSIKWKWAFRWLIIVKTGNE